MWGTWAAVGFAWLVTRLPLKLALDTGRALGWAAYHLSAGRRHIARVNLSLCFPEAGGAERERRLKQVFQHVGAGAMEAAITWLNPNSPLGERVQIEGLEHLRNAHAQGRGVLLLGGHFTCLDTFSPALTRHVDVDVMYRRSKNPVWDWLQLRGRRRYYGAVIERSDVRALLRALKAGHIVWYAADQDYGPKHSVFAPFFGVPAATITTPSRLAQFNESPVVFLEIYRDWHTLAWHVTLRPAPPGYPTGDEVADATRANELVEEAVARHPDQYLWIHRRFKTRPQGEARPY